jgi:hypothetical protein
MSVAQFNRDEMAKEYAESHLRTDPGIRTVYYLPAGAPEREIRLLEVNDLMAVRESDPLEPLDFGVDIDGTDPHSLLVVDVTPAQWDQVREGAVPLPAGWSLDERVEYIR